MQIRGIDVSAYTGEIDYRQVADYGIRVAILRITELGNTVDPTFERNYRGFRENRVLTGVYKYSYALSVEEARQEAQAVLDVLRGRKLEFPVFYDVEWNQQRGLPSSELTEIIREFRRVIVDGGYLFGIYCNTNWYNSVLDVSALPYDYWLAAYPYNDDGQLVPALRPPVGIGWQYSSKGQIPGIGTYVDLDVFYTDFGNDEPDDEKYFVYTVKPGDTLTAIAMRFHTTVEELVRLNDIQDPNVIQVGQELRIPDRETYYRAWVGECTGNGVHVRSGPGICFEPIKGYPYLDKGNLVDVVGEERASDKVLWYRVRIADKYEGYVRHDFIRRV